jgi:hypothetical protein
MIFITREIYTGLQDGSGRQKRAQREWEKRADIYADYVKVIAPLLPKEVRQLAAKGLHDARVEAATQIGKKLVITMDAKGALSAYRGRRLRLTFNGVRGRVPAKRLVGQWWLYEEAHLSNRAAFSLHAMFDKTDVEIEAEELKIEKV